MFENVAIASEKMLATIFSKIFFHKFEIFFCKSETVICSRSVREKINNLLTLISQKLKYRITISAILQSEWEILN